MTAPRPPRFTGPGGLSPAGAIASAVANGIGTGIVAYLSLAPLGRSIGLGVTAFVVSGLLLLSGVQARPWPREPEPESEWNRLGQRWEVRGLDSALQNPRYSGGRLLDPLAGLLDQLAARAGMQRDDPAFGLSQRQRELLTHRTAAPATERELRELIDFTVLRAMQHPQRPLPIPAALAPRGSGPRWIGHSPMGQWHRRKENR